MKERSDASFTLREIAKRIGVSHSAVYRHFPSKGALLAEIARQGFALLTAALGATLAPGESAERILRRQAAVYLRTAVTYPAHFRCMFGPRMFADEEAAPVDEACERTFECLAEATARLLGVGREEAAVLDASLAVWSLVHGLASLAIDGQLGDWAPESSVGRYEQLAEEATSRLLAGLSPR